MSGARRRAAAGAAAQTVAGAVARVADRSPLARSPRWSRTNYRGRTVTLAGGVAATVGAAAGAALTGDVRAVGLTLAAGTAGAYDDLVAPGHEARTDKGFRGHLAALRAGRVSGGVVKIVVIGASAWWAVGPVSRGHLDRAVRAVAVAGTANLVNLLDLRPGRAAKVVAAASGPLQWGTAGPLATAAGAAAGAVLPGDLREQTMLGDTGANALGALLGLRAASGPAGLALATAVLTSGLAVLSERVSFSAVIAGHPVLRRLDELGRPDDLDDLDELAARGGSRRADGPGRRA